MWPCPLLLSLHVFQWEVRTFLGGGGGGRGIGRFWANKALEGQWLAPPRLCLTRAFWCPGEGWGLVNNPSWLPPLKNITLPPLAPPPPPPILKSWCHHCPCALYPNLLVKEDGVSVHLISCLCQWLYSTVLVDLNECPSIFQKVQHSHSRHQKTTSNLLRINLKGIVVKFNEIWPIEGAMYITLW